MLESSIRIKDLIEASAKLGMEAVALTDKYVMSGTVEFYKQAKARNIKPITGCEVCLLTKTGLSHLTLLVKNEKGYSNLCQMVSRSHIRTTCAKDARLDIKSIEMEDLENFSEGLICLSGCSKGELFRLLKAKDINGAINFSKKLLEIFGSDFYIEIQRYKMAAYSSNHNLCSEALLSFAEKMKIPVAATNNVHYLTKNDYKIYRCLSKIKHMATKNDPTWGIIENNEHYLRSHREMSEMFSDVPPAVANTQKIADKCNFDFILGRVELPHFKTPEGESQNQYLEKLCRKGLELRYGGNPGKKVTERLVRELEVIAKTGYSGYFLVVADIARFACENKIPICGKGSAAGSLVSYILRISNVDPVENNLYFERFLNDERKEPPDIDIDISNVDRDRISGYLCSKYGREAVARVSSFATTKPRASIREAGRILGMAKDEIDYLIKTVPNYNRFFTSEKMQQDAQSSGLVDLRDPDYRKVLWVANKISGYVRHISMHPSAFIVVNYDLSKKVPMTLSESGEAMSQYDMNSIEDIGILKIDLINSLSLSLIANTQEIVEKKRNIAVDMSGTDYSDRKVYELMQKGQTLGIFQLESFGIRTLSRKIKPACLNDIMLLVSLYRPGPQQSGMVNNFIERKFGREKTTYIHRDLAPFLKETYGVILYQEQAMQVAIKIAGYSLSEADTLRKAMANLSREEMFEQRSRFISGAISRGYDRSMANEAFNLISKFASYGFVKAHAAAYAELSYKTCYLKAHFFAEFISVILTNNSGYYTKMQYIEEARRLGIKIKLPDINESGVNFTAGDNGDSIMIPLQSIRNLGYAGASSIINERKRNGKFLSFPDFYERIVGNCKVAKNAIENIIRIGAFDFTGISRRRLLLTFSLLSNLRKNDSLYKKNRKIKPVLETLFDINVFNQAFESQTKELCSTGSGDIDFSLEEKLEMEAEILGFYVSTHPLKCFKENHKKNLQDNNLSDFSSDILITRSRNFYDWIYRSEPRAQFQNPNEFSNPGDIFAAGIIISKKIEKTRNSKNMMFCTMEDEDGMYEAVFFPEAYQKSAKIIMDNPFIIIKGKLHFKDNNVSIIAKDVISIKSLKKFENLRKEENL